MAYETLRGLGPGVYSLEAMQQADLKRRDELAKILADPSARVGLFVDRSRVDVWSIGAPIPTVKTLLKIVLPGQRLGAIAQANRIANSTTPDRCR